MSRKSRKDKPSPAKKHGNSSAGDGYEVRLTPTAVDLLRQIRDKRHQRSIRARIEGLRHDPDKQGKALVGDLRGFRSLRAVGQRYRIIYRVEASQVVVFIVAVGFRKEGDKRDIYRVFTRIVEEVRKRFS